MYYTCTSVFDFNPMADVYATTLDVYVYVRLGWIHVLDVHVFFASEFEECTCRLL